MPTPIYERGLDRNEANHVPLTPLYSLDRCVSAAYRYRARRDAPDLGHDAQPLLPAGQRARPARCQARRHRIDHCA